MNNETQVNRGYSRAVVAVLMEGEVVAEAIHFPSVRSCAKYLGRNPAAVTKVCQGAWNTCNDHRIFYEEDYEKKFGKIIKDWDTYCSRSNWK